MRLKWVSTRILLGWCVVVSCSVRPFARADGLEPDEGVFAGSGPPDPYYLVLRGALLRDDAYRLCQLVSVPSFSAESAVYFVQQDDGSATVISRTLKSQLWGRMQARIRKMAKDRDSYSIGSESQAAALEGLRVPVDTRTAPLDPEAVAALKDACLAVLLQVHYPETPSNGDDGTTYHAGHWVPGAFLSGTTWSPKEGTIAADFIAMEATLKALAEASPEQRDTLRAELVSKARRLRDRMTPLK